MSHPNSAPVTGSVSGVGGSRGKGIASEEVYVGLAQLEEGVSVAIKVMVCRKWDATNTFGKYLGTEYILSDCEGAAIQCSARSNISHRFVTKLHEGCVYSLKNFAVVPNKDKFRIRRADPYTISLEGFTVVRKLSCDVSPFPRFPFDLTPLEDVELNDSAFLIDVIGCVTGLGNIRTTRGGSELVEFQLINERECRISVTLWAPLCHDILKRKASAIEPYLLILPGMNVKEFRGEPFLSNTSATTMFDAPDIPQIAELLPLFRKSCISFVTEQPEAVVAVVGTVYQLLLAGRDFHDKKKKSTMFHCNVRFVSVETKDGWFYFACGIGGCKRRVTRSGSKFVCPKCNKACDFPRVSFRLQLAIADSSGTVMVTMFDEVATKMLGKKAADLLAESEDDCNEDVLPGPIAALAGSAHILEVKSHTYYNQGVFESFSVNRVLGSCEKKILPKKREFQDVDDTADSTSHRVFGSGAVELSENMTPSNQTATSPMAPGTKNPVDGETERE